MENYIIANCTDVGKTRSVNEDSMVTFDTPENGRVVVVCDGMGGQNAGDVASQIAIKVIQDILTDNAFTSPEAAIKSSILAANQAILSKAAKDPSLIGMGSTCVVAIIKDGKLYYGSVGDSRIYYIANGMIRQITKDQSYVQTLVDAGEITEEQAEHHANKNEITNALGVATMTPPVICQMPITPEPGSVCLLCTDGLSGMVNNSTIMNIVMRKDKSLQERAELLVRQANDAGGHDNITVQLIEWSANGNAKGGNTYQANQKKKSNGMPYMVAIILLAIVCGGGAYWYFQKTEPKSEENIQPAVIQKKEPVKKQVDTTVKETIIKETVVEKNTSKKASSKKDKNKNGASVFNKVKQKVNSDANASKKIVGKSGEEKQNSQPINNIERRDQSKEKE